MRAARGCDNADGDDEIWYYPNNPGGLKTVTFTVSASSSTVGELSEWSGVYAAASLDQSGSATTASNVSSFQVSTSGSTTADGELAVTQFSTAFAISTFTAQSGWTHLYSDGGKGYVADYGLGQAHGVVSETETANTTTTWAGAIATFRPACAGGSLSMSAPGSTSFSALTLNGTDQTATATLVLTPDDERNTGAGWNITGTSTTLTSAGGKTLPTTATQVTAASAAAATNNCTLPTNSIGYPITLPAGASPPTAVKLYNAATSSGTGRSDVTLSFSLAVPANAYIGPYTSTWTFATVSGP